MLYDCVNFIFSVHKKPFFMNERLLASLQHQLRILGIRQSAIHYQLPTETLVQQTIDRGEGRLSETGALVIRTGTFTGRSPKDKFIVRYAISEELVDWNDFNQPIDYKFAESLLQKAGAYLSGRELWVRDAVACAHPDYALTLSVITETPAANLFAGNMFLAPDRERSTDQLPDWVLIHAPGFTADPCKDGVRSPHFAILDFFKRIILIGGTGYTGEMKKAVFTALNYLLPIEKKVLPMHCSANMGINGDMALFFGLSGTGKTTLSADNNRRLIGDDEHGWNDEGIFNFEGGCYAKCIDLSPEKEPQIFAAIRPGAMLENVTFHPGTNRVNYADKSITENTRVSYPPLLHRKCTDPPGSPASEKYLFPDL